MQSDMNQSNTGARVDLTDGGVGRSGSSPRPTIQVWFECAGLYQLVIRSADGTHYLARCGKCGKSMRFNVGQQGTSQRVFQVRC